MLTSDSLIQIVSTAVLATVGIVAAFIASRNTEKYRDQNEKAAEHLKEIRQSVLSPMLNQTDQHYLPILGFKTGMLTMENSETRKFGAGIEEKPPEAQWLAAVLPVISPLSRGLNDEEDRLGIEPGLFKDCQGNHFKKEITEWMRLTDRVDKLKREWLDLANTTTESVSKRLGLPVGKVWHQSEPNVTPYCGVGVLNRMAGVDMRFSVQPDYQNERQERRQSLTMGDIIIDLDKSGDLERAKKAVEEVIGETRPRFFELKKVAEAIDKEFIKFRVELVALLEKQKLPGKCDYLD